MHKYRIHWTQKRAPVSAATNVEFGKSKLKIGVFRNAGLQHVNYTREYKISNVGGCGEKYLIQVRFDISSCNVLPFCGRAFLYFMVERFAISEFSLHKFSVRPNRQMLK